MPQRRADRSLARTRSGIREQRRRILVYCEGQNTEKIYLRGLRTELRHQAVLKIGSQNGEPLSLVRAAKTDAKQFAGDPDQQFDEVWCVLDVEAPHEHPSLPAALREARDAGIKCVVSNPCFELWLVLHFRDQSGYLTTKQAESVLASLLPGYGVASGKSFDYDRVRPTRDAARQRADRLYQKHAENGTRCAHNPCSTGR